MLSWCRHTSSSGCTSAAGGFHPLLGGVVAVGVGVGVGEGVLVGVVPPVQVVPLSEKLVGAGLLPVQVPLKPNETVAPVPMAAL
ncbi:hypothetical protein [Micromonospora narathiwatensis]|uniref:hypothetical protein n=1 Tax=Micromonospora narathiwatensis TaxID=299146 RepID=UPI000AC2C7DE